MSWQTVVTEPSQLGESPFWHPQEELLYWVDIPARQILRANVFMGTLERKAGGAVIANGLAWPPDAKTAYWTDTTRHVIYAWDWDAASNAMTRRRVFQQLPGKPDGWKSGMPGYGGRPDGAAVDAEGNYYAAMFEGKRLLKFAPSGELLADIPVPVQCPTMPCFGGADLQTLYLTTACHGRPAAELTAMPLSGCVFSMRVEVPGLPVNFFVD